MNTGVGNVSASPLPVLSRLPACWETLGTCWQMHRSSGFLLGSWNEDCTYTLAFEYSCRSLILNSLPLVMCLLRWWPYLAASYPWLPAGTPRKIGSGCEPRYPKPQPYFRPKSTPDRCQRHCEGCLLVVFMVKKKPLLKDTPQFKTRVQKNNTLFETKIDTPQSQIQRV